MTEDQFQVAGDVSIKKLTLFSPNGKSIELLEYLIEFNLYESIFSPGLSGVLTLGDSRNILKEVPLLGEEILFVDINTPTSASAIRKVFRIFSISDKSYVQDGQSQIYNLHFCSVEIFRDVTRPIYKSFSGNIKNIVEEIYNDYLKAPRLIDTSDRETKESNLIFLSSPVNKVNFVSPGWSPIRCINWLSSKSEANTNKSSSFLFWETNKAFYFGSIDTILSNKTFASGGKYFYSSALANQVKDQQKKLFTINNISMNKIFDQLGNKLNGYLSSRVLDIDIYNKTFNNYDYDHGSNFIRYPHSEGDNSLPLFDLNTSRNPLTYVKINYNNPRLHGSAGNYTTRNRFVFGNRRSHLLELGNFNMSVVVPGRTDLEAGSLVDITLPKGFPVSPEDKTSNAKDDLYSGYYLITSLNHKINRRNHYITMDVSKDCLPSKKKL